MRWWVGLTVACSGVDAPPTSTATPLTPCVRSTEVCDGVDNDCDGVIDEGVGERVYRDRDADGFGDAAAPLLTCAPPAGWIARAGDCDDADAERFPGAPERCTGHDDDCDGRIDVDPADGLTFFVDADGDGLGDASQPVVACVLAAGLAADAGDCDDADPLVGAPAAVDHLDADGDGSPGPSTRIVCPAEVVYTASTDCDDSNPTVNPDADELPADGVDSDCDGDELCWSDADLDGFGIPDAVPVPDVTCQAPGVTADTTDCDDTSGFVFPGAEERCGNGRDDDCDPQTPDVPAPVGPWTFVDRTVTAGFDAPSSGTVGPCVSAPGRPVVADLEGDGDLDVFLPRVGLPDRLLVNDGTGVFTDQAAALGIGSGLSSVAAVFLDVDDDGDLDLFVAAAGVATHALYLADAGMFTSAGPVRGVAAVPSTCHGTTDLAVVDADADGDLDLHVLGTTSTLFLNDGLGFFTASSAPGVGSVGVLWLDQDHDGDADPWFVGPAGSSLLRNDGLAGYASWYVDTDPGARVVPLADGNALAAVVLGGPPRLHPRPTFGPVALDLTAPTADLVGADVDADGVLELATAGPDARLFAADGTDRSCTTGALDPSPQAHVVVFDADGDGDGDLLRVPATGAPTFLTAEGPPTTTVTIRVEQPPPNRDAIGAEVTVLGIPAVLLPVQGPRHVRLGVPGPVDVEVRWPDGSTTLFADQLGAVHLVRP